MPSPTPLNVERSLRLLGEHIATWRKLQGLQTAELANRAGIARSTLQSIEAGRGGTNIENVLRVLRALGIMEKVVESADPYTTDIGKLRADEVLPQRVRR